MPARLPTRVASGRRLPAGLLLRAALLALVLTALPLAPPATPRADAALFRPFSARVLPITAQTAERMSYSWRTGCPVPLRDLRLLKVLHWTFAGTWRAGELVVHESEAQQVVAVFRRLYYARYPIERMALVDVYGGDDDRSMAANNSSAFNCRTPTGRSSGWSEHSYGTAIDVNPIQNPYVSATGTVAPPAGAAYVDRRTRRHPAMVLSGDAVVRAFAEQGWRWGGTWTTSKDYQHFSRTGR